MRSPARFIVDTHAHITTLYQPKGQKGIMPPEKVKEWTVNEVMGRRIVEMEPFDNSPLCLYDMERYGIDMCLLKPSVIGTTNEAQATLVEKYPDKFRAFCSAGNYRHKNTCLD